MNTVTAPNDETLFFLPLGGTGEIGMNLNLYGWGHDSDDAKWVMIDLGVTFSDPNLPGLEVIMADPIFIEERRHNLLALVLTHAHEDHLGAVPYLWKHLGCPVYATPFTAEILRRKLSEVPWGKDVPITEIPLGGHLDMGPFALDFITLTHSIPEPSALAIHTKAGTVLHTGDWKFDPDPVLGSAANTQALTTLGDKGVLALIGDSTNVFVEGRTGSEGDILETLTERIKPCTGRVVVACFASNVARLHTIMQVAAACERQVVIAGRSMKRMVSVAQKTGWLNETQDSVDERDMDCLDPRAVLLICTGSQGEPRAILNKLAHDRHPHIRLQAGDSVFFSSRIIPGNERAIGAMQNIFIERGINVINAHNDDFHVSGHPARDELAAMYAMVKPRIVIPVHGERRHLEEHARLAEACGVAQTLVLKNGDLVCFEGGSARLAEHVSNGRLGWEGNRLIPVDGTLMRSRIRSLHHGFVVASVVVDDDGYVLDKPQVSGTGVIEHTEEHLMEKAGSILEKALENCDKHDIVDDERLREILNVTLRRFFKKALDKKPMTEIHLMRLSYDDE